ncbi:MAG: hypothetical protein IJ545_04660 [Alphaproteobacteria bacterium]|nr:hypothetical protein [Alphaproteobacteria bacterium]
MTKDEIINEINICENVLQQHDYMARKVAFEVAEKLKELNPSLSMPVYEQYKDMEQEAKALRLRIKELKQQLENAED